MKATQPKIRVHFHLHLKSVNMVIDRGVHTKNFLSNSVNTNHRPDDEIDSDVSFSPSFCQYLVSVY